MPQSQATANPWQQEEEKQDKIQRVQSKQTNALEAHRPALSSPSEVVIMLKVLKNMRTKGKARLNMKRPVVKTTKPHKIRITPQNGK